MPEDVSRAWDDRKGPTVFATVDKDGVSNAVFVCNRESGNFDARFAQAWGCEKSVKKEYGIMNPGIVIRNEAPCGVCAITEVTSWL